MFFWSLLTILLPVYEGNLIISRFWQLTYLSFYLIALRNLFEPKIFNSYLVRLLLVWAIYTSCINLFSFQDSPFGYLETLVDTLWMPCTFIVFSEVFSETSENSFRKVLNKYFLFYFSIVVLISFYLMISFSGNENIYEIKDQKLINSTYWILFLVPFCFYLDKKTKYILFAVILISIVVSSKRTPLLAFSPILIFSFYRDFLNPNMKNIILGVGVSLLLYFMFSLVVKNIEINSSQRLTDTVNDIRAEPRYILIAESWDNYKSKNLISIVFGSGHRSSAIDRKSGFSKTTHNDFFETLYSYGLIGLILYLKIITQIIKHTVLIPKDYKKRYDSYCSTLILLVTVSMTSHLIINPTYIAYLTIIWGLVISKNKGNYQKQ